MNLTVEGLIYDAVGATLIIVGGFYGDRIAKYVTSTSGQLDGHSNKQMAKISRMGWFKNALVIPGYFLLMYGFYLQALGAKQPTPDEPKHNRQGYGVSNKIKSLQHPKEIEFRGVPRTRYKRAYPPTT
jgi:hypothetical protein